MKKIPFFFLVISLILATYIFYKSEIALNHSNISDYKKFYYICFLFLFLSVVSFYASDIFNRYLVVVLISAFISLYLFEGYLNLSNKINLAYKKSLFKKNTGKEYDTRSHIKYYTDQLLQNPNIVLPIGPSAYLKDNVIYLPLSGISNSKTIFCNEHGEYVTYISDRYGFNNNDNLWNEKIIDYLLIGDSFVHGQCVKKEDNIESNLSKLSNLKVINLGYGGNGPLIEYAVLREFLNFRIRPKNVLFFYFEGNDLLDLTNEVKNKILYSYLVDQNYNQDIFRNQNLTNKLANQKQKKKLNLETYKNKENFSFLKNYLKLSKSRSILFPEKKNALDNNFKKILSEIKLLADRKNFNLFFIYLPEFARYKFNYSNNSYEEIKKILSDLNITLIDVHKDLFLKVSDPLVFFPFSLNGHYNSKGYKEISKLIYEKIK